MAFVRIEDTLATCDAYLRAHDQDDPRRYEIEAYLVAYVVVLIVSEYEELLLSLFSARADMCGDAHVASYLKSRIQRAFTSPKLSKIKDSLRQCGSDYHDTFWSVVENTEHEDAWGNLINARHTVVHKSGNQQLTWRELKKNYAESKEIFRALIFTLGLPSTSIAGL